MSILGDVETKGANRWLRSSGRRGESYDRHFLELEAAGHDVHGEATLVESLGPRSVLDAGCGTGRVAIELARRGIDVVGVDLDCRMLESAREKAPDLEWLEADVATVDVGRAFDAVVMAGNVMIFLAPGTEAATVKNLARHLHVGGVLVSGFTLERAGLSVEVYDLLCKDAGLETISRWSTWDKKPFRAGDDYAVSVHRLRTDR